MALRQVKPDEARSLSSLGDMRSPANEHVLGVDGIAIIVNKTNPLQSLTKEQISRRWYPLDSGSHYRLWLGLC